MKLTGNMFVILSIVAYLSLTDGQGDLPGPPCAPDDQPFPSGGCHDRDDVIEPGEVSDEQVVDVEVQHLIDRVKEGVERIVGRTLSTYTAIRYRRQTRDRHDPMRGFSYWVKVEIGAQEYIHIFVVNQQEIGPELIYVHTGKTLSDRITDYRA